MKDNDRNKEGSIVAGFMFCYGELKVTCLYILGEVFFQLGDSNEKFSWIKICHGYKCFVFA